jgi:hypothetical protein
VSVSPQNPVVAAGTEDETFNWLLDAVPGGDNLVLAAGRDLNERATDKHAQES